jgi:nicotinamidase-related amidase
MDQTGRPKKISLLIVDPQVDFIDQTKGKLAIQGAESVASRIAEFIKRWGDTITKIAITKDSHSPLHIENAYMWNAYTWTDAGDRIQSALPDEVIRVTYSDIKAGKYEPARCITRRPEYYDVLSYIEYHGYIDLWPAHCITGSVGETIWPEILQAAESWQRTGGKFWKVDYLEKGKNPFKVSYSAFSTPDRHDSKKDLIEDAEIWMCNEYYVENELGKVHVSEDLIVVCGFAEDYCVASCVEDLVEQGFGHRLVIPKNLCCAIHKDTEHPVYSYAKTRGARILEKDEDISKLLEDNG